MGLHIDCGAYGWHHVRLGLVPGVSPVAPALSCSALPLGGRMYSHVWHPGAGAGGAGLAN